MAMLKIAFILLLLLLLVVPALLAYGYWHARTHATLHVSLSHASPEGRDTPLPQAELSFLDGSNQVVAKARTEEKYGVVYLAEPPEYSCHEIEQKAPFDTAARAAWAECFQRQSRWLSSQVPAIASIEVVTGSCTLRVPANFSTYNDWWWWWVPLPHAGGTPYWNYSMYIRIDPVSCSTVTA